MRSLDSRREGEELSDDARDGRFESRKVKNRDRISQEKVARMILKACS